MWVGEATRLHRPTHQPPKIVPVQQQSAAAAGEHARIGQSYSAGHLQQQTE